MSESLKGKVAIVTGGASGIGRSIAQAFTHESAAGVIVADIKPVPQEPWVVGATYCQADVSRADDVRAVVDRTIEKFGRVDVLINNAGIAPILRWPDVTEENWRHVLDVNLNSALLCVLEVLPHMQRQKFGRIVNISSVGAFLGSVTAHPAYGVSKAGLIAMTKSLAKECAADGILVNAIAPGSFDTPILESFGEEAREFYANASLLKRHGSPDELAAAVVFLVSNAASYITGSTLHVNGGSLLV